MADRTVKSDDTNDLVLSNNDGSAKIEVNEAQTVVLTGGSTTALTIDTNGDTTLAGTANNIGTATGTFDGTLGSSVTFPAGHVIQTVQEEYDGGNSATLAANASLTRVSDGSSNYNWKGTITSVGASSWVLITMSCAVMTYKSSSVDASGGIGIVRNNGSDTVIYNPGVSSLYYRSGDSTTREYAIQTGISVIDKSPDTGTNNYYLAYKTQGVSGYSIYINSNSMTPTTFILQEISQ